MRRVFLHHRATSACCASNRSLARRVKARVDGQCRRSWTSICGWVNTTEGPSILRISISCRTAGSRPTRMTTAPRRPSPSPMQVSHGQSWSVTVSHPSPQHTAVDTKDGEGTRRRRRGHVPPKFGKIFLINYHVKFGHFSGKIM